ncbi:Something about silencing 10 [Micractinium conductrix]|uniref:Something about silencing 10 n=1 Tax=Micractinium conductrix TaxID=554055 RepID=A0A2P6VIR8_9CHLO|nr:Something about silencing 10 [Micractinium conductrix]|eukprot:PSC73947.1 Something about silencing 10 [Micractinium conductrix]
MAKPSSAKKGRRPPAGPKGLPSDLEDEVEKFHKQRDVLPLSVDDDALSDGSLDSLDEEEVLGLGGSDEELDTDDEIEADSEYGRMAKQAKALGAKLRIQQGEEEAQEEDEEGGERDEQRGWGASKRAYYGADLADLEGSEDEEDMRDEEEEAVRLQREAAAALRPEDFDQSEDDEEEEEEGSSSGEESEEEEDGTLGAAAAAAAGVRVERVRKDLGALSSEQRLAAVQQDAPELLQLIAELREGLTEVRSRVGPLLKEVRQGDLATAEGVSYLEAKHLLLLHYCTAIVFYLLMKAEGRPVQAHPVIARLVEARAYLEKIRPIDKKLQYQIEKLLKATAAVGGGGGDGADGEAAAALAAGGDDPLRYGPRPDALVAKQTGAAPAGDDGGGGAYRPPRLNPVSMELDERAGELSARERRQLVQAQRRASRSGLVQELAAEVEGAPEEQRYAAAGLDSAAALRERQRLAAREDVEEELMIRVPLSKEERKRLKLHRREGLSGKALLDDFADEVADIVGAGGGEGSGIDAIFQRHRASQKWGADLEAQAMAASRKAPRSGDADLPQKEPLYERRAKFDSVRARQQMALDEDEAPEQLGGKRRRGGEEDEFYAAAKEAAVAKKSKRREAYLHPETLPPVEDPTTAAARGITRDIEKNRGLTPHRRKDMKNPRKKHRVKFAQATERRKGQVQEVRQTGGAYGGEATGIKARVSKSVRL